MHVYYSSTHVMNEYSSISMFLCVLVVCLWKCVWCVSEYACACCGIFLCVFECVCVCVCVCVCPRHTQRHHTHTHSETPHTHSETHQIQMLILRHLRVHTLYTQRHAHIFWDMSQSMYVCFWLYLYVSVLIIIFWYILIQVQCVSKCLCMYIACHWVCVWWHHIVYMYNVHVFCGAVKLLKTQCCQGIIFCLLQYSIVSPHEVLWKAFTITFCKKDTDSWQCNCVRC